MQLTGKLLTYFFTIILVVLITFGFISYQMAYDIAVEKEQHLLESIVNQEGLSLSFEYKQEPSLQRLIKYVESNKGDDHMLLLVNQEGNIVFPEQPDKILGVPLWKFPLREISMQKSNSGHILQNEKLFLWATAPVFNSQYQLINFYLSNNEIKEPFTSLASRMIVAGIVIVWIAVWIALIITTAVSRSLQEKTDALEYQALHDGITGLPNRNNLVKKLENAINIAQGKNHTVTLVLVKLIRFTEVNDTLGHLFGDMLLKTIGERLEKLISGKDVVARVGENDFTLLLPGTDALHDQSIIQKILDAMQEPFKIEELNLEFEIILGVALYPNHGRDAATLLRHVDVAMRQASDVGELFSFYNYDKDPYSLKRLALIGELRQSTEREELVLHYQPKIEIQTGAIDGAEALLYWQHPQHQLMAPGHFIPLAETTTLIKPLTLWVLENAIAQCASWIKRSILVPVSVNLSARMLHDTQIPTHIEKFLGKYQLASKWLKLEITETAIMMDPTRAITILTKLNDMGVRISIDDFGSGYTSLAYIKELPIDEVKIDRSFIMNMLSDKNDAIIVESIIGLLQKMGLQVVGEGVESKEIFDVLAEKGCDVAQGFYLSRPIPVLDFEQWYSAKLRLSKVSRIVPQ